MPKPADKPLTQKSDAQFEHVADGASVLIGGLSPGQFRHGLRASKWGGQHWLDLAAVGLEDPGQAKLKKHGQKDAVEVAASWRKGGKKKSRIDRWYAGSTEWEIEYTELPDQPIQFRLSLSPGTQAHHQSALTPEEIARGCARPENVADSFAIYAPVANRLVRPDGSEIENYKTGKIAHLYRPCWIAADGTRIWATHSLSGDLWAVLPPDASRVAGHPGPWVLDPTFGYESVGASQTYDIPDCLLAEGPYPGLDGSVTAVTWYCKAAAAYRATFGLYTQSGAGQGTLLGDSAGGTVPNTDWDWLTQNLDSPNPSASSVATYYLAMNVADGNVYLRYDSLADFFNYYKTSVTYTHGVLPATLPTMVQESALKLTVYATVSTATPSVERLFRRQFSRPFACAFGG